MNKSKKEIKHFLDKDTKNPIYTKKLIPHLKLKSLIIVKHKHKNKLGVRDSTPYIASLGYFNEYLTIYLKFILI